MADVPADTIWVERDRYHTAIVFSTQLVTDLASELSPVLNQQALVRFGWGDGGYYGAPQKSFWLVFKALFLPTGSVMEVSGFDRLSDVGDSVVAIPLQELDIGALLAFIRDSFVWDSRGQPTLMRTGLSGFRYYRARGIYHLFKNCNNWTAQALQRSGLRVNHLLAFFAGSVMKQLR